MKFYTDKETRLIDFLQEKIGCSTTKIKKMVKHAKVLVDGVPIDQPNPILSAGVRVELANNGLSERHNLNILFEDADLIVVAKPVGILSIDTISDVGKTLFGTVNQYVKQKSKNRENAFIVHRLDQKVSGVLLFAKSRQVQQALQDHWYEYVKRYHALVEGCPSAPTGTLTSWLQETSSFRVFSGPESPASKLAITHYALAQKSRYYSLLEITLGTGRKNQIRVQLSDIGCPIVGDVKYGAQRNPIGRIGLHAYSMAIIHPTTGEKMLFSDPTPKDFFKFFRNNSEIVSETSM